MSRFSRRMTQEMRNRIHAGRWLKHQDDLNPDLFSAWCHIGARLCQEIRDCLFVNMSNYNTAQMRVEVAKLTNHSLPGTISMRS
jgi:hypothetical protein